MKKQILTFGLVYILVISATAVFAGSGSSSTILQNAHSFRAFYGSSEIGWPYALINYIDVEVSFPGLRIGGNVCAKPVVIPDTSTQNITTNLPQVCKSVGPGISSTSIRFRVHTPPNATSRIRVRRGSNVVRTTFTYNYSGSMSFGGCGSNTSGMTCGQAVASFTIQ